MLQTLVSKTAWEWGSLEDSEYCYCHCMVSMHDCMRMGQVMRLYEASVKCQSNHIYIQVTTIRYMGVGEVAEQ